MGRDMRMGRDGKGREGKGGIGEGERRRGRESGLRTGSRMRFIEWCYFQ